MSTPLNPALVYTLLAAVDSGSCTERYGIEAEAPDTPNIHLSPTAVASSQAVVTFLDEPNNVVSITVGGQALVWYELDGQIVLGWLSQVLVLVPTLVLPEQASFTLSALVANEPVYVTPLTYPLRRSFMLLVNIPPYETGEVAFSSYGSLAGVGDATLRYSNLHVVTLTWIFYTTFPPVLVPITPAACLFDCDAVVCALGPCARCF